MMEGEIASKTAAKAGTRLRGAFLMSIFLLAGCALLSGKTEQQLQPNQRQPDMDYAHIVLRLMQKQVNFLPARLQR
jgi:hypothetical protein